MNVQLTSGWLLHLTWVAYPKAYFFASLRDLIVSKFNPYLLATELKKDLYLK